MRLKRVSPLAKKLALENLENPFAHTERGLVSATFRKMFYSQILFRLRDPFLPAWSLTICWSLMTAAAILPGRRKP
jgi:hypothetical protein